MWLVPFFFLLDSKLLPPSTHLPQIFLSRTLKKVSPMKSNRYNSKFEFLVVTLHNNPFRCALFTFVLRIVNYNPQFPRNLKMATQVISCKRLVEGVCAPSGLAELIFSPDTVVFDLLLNGWVSPPHCSTSELKLRHCYNHCVSPPPS